MGFEYILNKLSLYSIRKMIDQFRPLSLKDFVVLMESEIDYSVNERAEVLTSITELFETIKKPDEPSVTVNDLVNFLVEQPEFKDIDKDYSNAVSEALASCTIDKDFFDYYRHKGTLVKKIDGLPHNASLIEVNSSQSGVIFYNVKEKQLFKISELNTTSNFAVQSFAWDFETKILGLLLVNGDFLIYSLFQGLFTLSAKQELGMIQVKDKRPQKRIHRLLSVHFMFNHWIFTDIQGGIEIYALKITRNSYEIIKDERDFHVHHDIINDIIDVGHSMFVMISCDHSFSLWDGNSAKLEMKIRLAGSIMSATFLCDPYNFLVFATCTTSIPVYGLNGRFNRGQVLSLEGHLGNVIKVSSFCSSSICLLATYDDRYTCKIWSSSKLQLLKSIQLMSAVDYMQWLNGNRLIIIGNRMQIISCNSKVASKRNKKIHIVKAGLDFSCTEKELVYKRDSLFKCGDETKIIDCYVSETKCFLLLMENQIVKITASDKEVVLFTSDLIQDPFSWLTDSLLVLKNGDILNIQGSTECKLSLEEKITAKNLDISEDKHAILGTETGDILVVGGLETGQPQVVETCKNKIVDDLSPVEIISGSTKEIVVHLRSGKSYSLFSEVLLDRNKLNMQIQKQVASLLETPAAEKRIEQKVLQRQATRTALTAANRKLTGLGSFSLPPTPATKGLLISDSVGLYERTVDSTRLRWPQYGKMVVLDCLNGVLEKKRQDINKKRDPNMYGLKFVDMKTWKFAGNFKSYVTNQTL
jgi:WD40 repeat protein